MAKFGLTPVVLCTVSGMLLITLAALTASLKGCLMRMRVAFARLYDSYVLFGRQNEDEKV